jgi:hypothetical protein
MEPNGTKMEPFGTTAPLRSIIHCEIGTEVLVNVVDRPVLEVGSDES